MLSRILRLHSGSRRVAARGQGVSSVRDVRSAKPSDRRCIVKGRFVPMNAYGVRAAALHLAYIERDGVESDGSPGRLYGSLEAPDVRDNLAARLENEKRQFRFIVSPEDGADTNLTGFTRRLMVQMERDLGRKLVWGGVNHWNTDNPHVHIIVRGLDADGQDLTIDGQYIARGIRSRASEILTGELGPRTALDVHDQLSREVTQERFTSLDRALQGLVAPDGSILETWLAGKGRITDARMLARLATLQRLGLVTRVSPIEWRFEPGWVETLRGLGQANDVIKRIHAALPSPDPSRFVIVDQSQLLEPVEGVVRRKGLHDELAAHAYAVVEALDGRAFYVKLAPANAERLREDDVVRVAVGPEKPRVALDAALAEFASGTGGIIRASHAPLAGEGPASPAPDYLRRLAELERAGIVTRVGDGWNIPPDLEARVIAHAARRPSPLRIRVQRLGPPIALQQRYRGPTWLDTLDPTNVAQSPSAFGAELADSLVKRAGHLRDMGIAGAPAERGRALAALEARILGTRLASEHRLDLVDPQGGMTGSLTVSEKLPSGAQYAIIVDEAAKRLCVLPASKRLRLMDGRAVRLWRNTEGHVVVPEGIPARARDPKRSPGR
jgi:type IV secretory pathway VirD2 relaxase